MHVAQPPESVTRIAAAVTAVGEALGPLGLVALSELVTLSGSAVLGLAVAEGALDPAAAWTASRIDETWQAEQWGEDAEAAEQAAHREAAFRRAGWVAAALRAPDGPLSDYP
jgi:chaperone required for assembly of F1-ATPase